MKTSIPSNLLSSAFIPLPSIESCTLEIGVRRDGGVELDPDDPVFAFGFATAGTGSSTGPGVTICSSGKVIGNDNPSNSISTGGPVAFNIGFTVFRMEWSSSGMALFRDGEQLGTLPAPIEGISGSVAGVFAQFAFRSGTDEGIVGYVDYIDIQGVKGDASAPLFWTELLGTHEVGGEAPPGPDPDPEAPDATTIALPYNATVPEAANIQWFKFTVTSRGFYTIDTLGSESPLDNDTFLALFADDGTLLASNEDVDEVNEDYRSQILFDLAAGTYFVALSVFQGHAAGGWDVTTTGASNMFPNTVLNVAPAATP